jgi:hypothetical protein
MYLYNIRLELQTEIERMYVVSYLHRKGMKLPEIVAELAVVYHENAFDENRVKYWLHEMNLITALLVTSASLLCLFVINW